MTPSDIVRLQPGAWRLLSRAFRAGRVAGTYLFHGPRGVGHWALFVNFAALLNCEQPRPSETDPEIILPCGACRNCRRVFALDFEGLSFAVPLPPHDRPAQAVDLTIEFLETKRHDPFAAVTYPAKPTIPIAVARQIKQHLSRRASEGMTRVVVFYQMEQMLHSSADALLKLIEEPPERTVIILTAERPERLLPTIQSRAQRIRLHRCATNALQEYLAAHYEGDEARLALAARLADGSVARAVAALADDEAGDDDNSTRLTSFRLFQSLLQEDTPEALGRLTESLDLKDRSRAEELLRHWQSYLRDCANYAVLENEGELVNVDFAADLERLAPRFARNDLALRLTESIKNALADLRLNVHIPGALSALVITLRSQVEAAA